MIAFIQVYQTFIISSVVSCKPQIPYAYLLMRVLLHFHSKSSVPFETLKEPLLNHDCISRKSHISRQRPTDPSNLELCMRERLVLKLRRHCMLHISAALSLSTTFVPNYFISFQRPSNSAMESCFFRCCCAVLTACFHFFPNRFPSITRSTESSHKS